MKHVIIRAGLPLLVIASLLLSGCGGGAEPTSAPENSSTSAAEPSATPVPATPTPEGTNIVIDGSAADWADEAIENVPAFTEAAGPIPEDALDFVRAAAFQNMDALYVMVEPADPAAVYHTVIFALRIGEQRYFVGVRSTGHVDINDESGKPLPTRYSSIAVDSVFELRLDLRDFGSPKQLVLENVSVFYPGPSGAGFPEWMRVESWGPKPSAPRALHDAPPATTQIVIDGAGDDWAGYPIGMTDLAGDQAAGGADLTEARYFVNDKYLYMLIKLDHPEGWDDMAVALRLDEQTDQLNLRPNNFVTIGLQGTGGSPLVIDITVGEFVELKVPLDQIPGTGPVRSIDGISVYNHDKHGNEPVDESDFMFLRPLAFVRESEPVPGHLSGGTVWGVLHDDTTWSGEIHVSGDIMLDTDVTLKIEPGTAVFLTPNRDDTHRGQSHIDEYIGSHNDPVGSAEWDQNAITIDGRGGIIDAVGTAEKPIVFRPEGDSTSVAQWDGIYIERGTLQYAKILYGGRTPIQITGRTDGTPKEQVVIAYNEVRGFMWGGITMTTYNAWIHHNIVDGGGHQAMFVGSQSIAENNLLMNCQNALFITGVEVVVRNNIVVDCARGIQAFIEHGHMPAGSQISIVNNTVVQRNGPPAGWYYQGQRIYEPFSDGAGIGIFIPSLKLTIENNLVAGPFSEGLGFHQSPGSGSLVDHNLVWGVAETVYGSGGQAPLAADPLLAQDYTLMPGSPAIDAGDPAMQDADGSPADLGAFGGEFGDWAPATLTDLSALPIEPISAPRTVAQQPAAAVATSTPPATSAASSTAASTATSKPVSTSTKAPTATAAPLPVAACRESETELFASDFESGTGGWSFEPATAWKIIDNDSKVLQGVGHVHARRNASWADSIWRLRVKIVSGRVHLNFHAKDEQRYLISFAPDWTQAMKQPGGQMLQEADVAHALGEWHVLEISLLDGVLSISTDGAPEVSYVDSSPLGPGGLWLEVLDGSTVLFDDVHVCQP